MVKHTDSDHDKNFTKLKHKPGLTTKLSLVKQQRVVGVLIIVVVALIGVYIFAGSHAASPTASLEAEAGTLSNGATAESDTSASGGQYVQFGAPTSTTWDCTQASISPGSSCPLAWPTQWTDPTDLTGSNYADYGYPATGLAAYFVNQDVWSPVGNQTQTIQANANKAGDWQVTSNVKNPSGSTTTYPNSGTFSYAGVLDDYTSLTSTNTVSIPNDANLNTHAMQDDWLTPPGQTAGYNYEVMIQYDAHNDNPCPTTAVDSGGGWNWGVTATDVMIDGQPWFLCDGQNDHTGSGCPSNGGCGAVVWKMGVNQSAQIDDSSVTLDLKAMFQWLEHNDVPGESYPYVEPGSSVFSISSGFEVQDTGGKNETLKMSKFTVNAVGAPSPCTTQLCS